MAMHWCALHAHLVPNQSSLRARLHRSRTAHQLEVGRSCGCGNPNLRNSTTPETAIASESGAAASPSKEPSHLSHGKADDGVVIASRGPLVS